MFSLSFGWMKYELHKLLKSHFGTPWDTKCRFVFEPNDFFVDLKPLMLYNLFMFRLGGCKQVAFIFPLLSGKMMYGLITTT